MLWFVTPFIVSSIAFFILLASQKKKDKNTTSDLIRFYMVVFHLRKKIFPSLSWYLLLESMLSGQIFATIYFCKTDQKSNGPEKKKLLHYIINIILTTYKVKKTTTKDKIIIIITIDLLFICFYYITIFWYTFLKFG